MTFQPRPWIAQLGPYRGGGFARDDAGGLALNEAPWAPGEQVRQAVTAELDHLHRYPDPLGISLRDALASDLGVDADHILLSNGSDELLLLLALSYAGHGGTLLCADPPYRLHEKAGIVAGAEVRAVALREWRHDLAAMAAVEADLAYLCNPHNPTGTLVTGADLRWFLEHGRSKLVVVDEAYIEFADDPALSSVIRLADEGRLVVLRTFSKAFGLAGARLGYLVGPTEVVSTLQAVRPPFSVGRLSQAAGLAALADVTGRAELRAVTRRNREQMTALFAAAGYAAVPSQANFVLILVDDEAEVIDRLGRHGVSVRPGSSLGVPGSIRVTVPGPEGLDRLQAALR